MGWPSTLSYAQVAANGIRRSLSVLAHYGDLETATELLTANPSLADDPEALVAAAEQGHESIVHLLLRYCPQLAERVAVVARTRELTEFLFQKGMNPNLARWLGVTPLHRFAQQGNVEHAGIFLSHGADLHARDEEYQTTPLGYAALSGKLRMVEFLLRCGARPALPDDPVWATPLALATFKGHDDVVRMLRLSESKGRPPAYDLKSLESLANDLVLACQSGEADAFGRVVDHFYIRRPMAWDRPGETIRASRLRRFVRERLGLPQSEPTKDPLALSDARLLIARSYGFESWRDLETAAE
jgi:Ankyrin repeats (3 copies)